MDNEASKVTFSQRTISMIFDAPTDGVYDISCKLTDDLDREHIQETQKDKALRGIALFNSKGFVLSSADVKVTSNTKHFLVKTSLMTNYL